MTETDQKRVGVRLLWLILFVFALSQPIIGYVQASQTGRGLGFGKGELRGKTVKLVDGEPLPVANYPFRSFDSINVETCEDEDPRWPAGVANGCQYDSIRGEAR